MINEVGAKQYCCEDISLIENYDSAVNDSTHMWHCHHRDETDLGMSRKDLLDKGQYWGVPANKLVFLRKSDHFKLHNANLRDETLQKMSDHHVGFTGKVHSEETKSKMSESRKGKPKPSMRGRHLSDEHKRKIGAIHRGKPSGMSGKRMSEESRMKLSISHKGKHFSDEHKARISEAKKVYWAKKRLEK